MKLWRILKSSPNHTTPDSVCWAFNNVILQMVYKPWEERQSVFTCTQDFVLIKYGKAKSDLEEEFITSSFQKEEAYHVIRTTQGSNQVGSGSTGSEANMASKKGTSEVRQASSSKLRIGWIEKLQSVLHTGWPPAFQHQALKSSTSG